MDGTAHDRIVLELDDRHLGVWREDVCDRMLDADAPWSAGQRLDLQLALHARGGVVSLQVASAPGGPALARGRARIAHNRHPDMLGLTVVTAGTALLELEDRTIELAAGDVCLLSSDVRFRKRMGARYAESFLYCPLATATAALGRAAPALAPGVAARAPLTCVLAETLVGIGRQAAVLDAAGWQPLVGAVLGLSAAAFAPRAAVDAAATASAAEAAWRARIDRHIDERLADPALSPPSIAAALRISLRYLHRLHEPTGQTIAATITARRLDRARALLLDPARRRLPIATIAALVGYRRADHFSRAFRARFGVAPRDLRERRSPIIAG